ncbi:sugar kinase [Sansalvadorimonas sp. 2012CJ34-2]|uniref:Sugar kinase n=1 Tax=Parendozoicomonas callyspongiae TaxID=2942213 RepID=A0ABT0PGA2_9GAMM|nr:sugar kinase [Sansalvadorimonas sp. 2012CJ34-2]MCL6270417.1 sugar kinase [Sansalvadorimonas sp. 2012CJ34-2]
MNRATRIAVIGECMVELSDIGHSTYQKSFAGDTLNTAVYLARGLKGTRCRVSFITALGEDPLSEQMMFSWSKEGIECDHIAHIKDKLPGLYSIQLDKSGERSFFYWRNDSAARKLFGDNVSNGDHRNHEGLSDLQLKSLTHDFSHIYLSGISLAILDPQSRIRLIALLQKAQENGTSIIFDNNYRPRLWNSTSEALETVNQVLDLTSLALVTFDDEQALFGDRTPEETLQRLQGIPEVVVKSGAEGCIVEFRDERKLIPAKKVKTVLDTTAAGDSFNGGYLAARVRNYPPIEAARFGHAMAAEVIQHKGAIVPQEAIKNVIQDLQQ